MKALPMKLTPAFKDYLWGGSRLKEEYAKETNMTPLAESWEISCHPDGSSIVADGIFKGESLKNVLEKNPQFMGKANQKEFPILVKLIDAQDNLSLQVHPDNAYALEHENQLGKNEFWYVLQADEGAELALGFTQPVDKAEFRERIENNTILDVVNWEQVKPGDCFEIPAGMLHAIGKGTVIAEVQQSSNVTYRVYDYDRRDAQGNPRELHVSKALDVTDSNLKAKNCKDSKIEELDGYNKQILTQWEWFTCEKLTVSTKAKLIAGEDSFQGITLLDGELKVVANDYTQTLKKGESMFVPAGLGEYTLEGKGELLLVYLD